MQKLIHNLKWLTLSIVVGIVIGGGLIAVKAWTEPTMAPPGGNIGAPINTSGIGQMKAGGLVLNTGGAANGLIVQNGNVGIGTTAPTQKLDVNGYVKGTGVCIGADCRTAWPASTDTKCNTSGSCSQICVGSDCRTAWPESGGNDLDFSSGMANGFCVASYSSCIQAGTDGCNTDRRDSALVMVKKSGGNYYCSFNGGGWTTMPYTRGWLNNNLINGWMGCMAGVIDASPTIFETEGFCKAKVPFL